MSGPTLVLVSPSIRRRAIAWIANAPEGSTVVLAKPKRSTEQNARMWAMLTDVARQQTYHEMKLSPNDWKLIFMNALPKEAGWRVRLVPNLQGDGFLDLGVSSSKLTKSQMSDLMELISAYCAEHGIVLSEPREAIRAA